MSPDTAQVVSKALHHPSVCLSAGLPSAKYTATGSASQAAGSGAHNFTGLRKSLTTLLWWL